ncbi:TetR-like C-terminal domain-containing protein [Vagococcus hydrophili]|uniref:TetR family transcriptional regulator n=1 Tax=Vagococcus hydrophili TaxID=2714947 RepID=A0A6G8AUZ4_9ENTE|nr:TetR-like C-terminal domain-containing protein [Vagococcus hydrophili]QIL48789.1 TetR family transcriptional regulator [Vagococcus hydrophili]
MAKQYTKKLIHDTFIKMLNEEPLKRITVKDLALACEINRNAFYYYYADIYELLSEIFETNIQLVVDEFNESNSWEDSFLKATDFALANKKAIYHVYDSMQKEELVHFIFEISGNMMKAYVKCVNQEIQAPEADQEYIAYFYQCALTGMVVKWLQSGMKEEPKEVISRIGFLFDGNIEISLKRAIDK